METIQFLKLGIFQNGKFPQKLTFNFIKQFGEGVPLSFNELNLRKCLTIKLKGRPGVSSYQNGEDEEGTKL